MADTYEERMVALYLNSVAGHRRDATDDHDVSEENHMSPYFNTETGEVRDADLDTDTPGESDVPDSSSPEPEPAATPLTRPSAAPASRAPAWIIPRTMTAVEARREFDRLRSEWIADPRHVLGDDRHPEHAAALAHYSALGALADGRDPAEGEEVLGEVFANGQIRPLGADALTPGPRPALPEGHAWDEAALVLAETEAHALGARPSFVMEFTDALAEIVEQAERRGGVGWTETDRRAELERRHGRDGAARMIDNARFATETLLEIEDPLLVQKVRELGEKKWRNDPLVTRLFGGLVYGALSEGEVTPAKEALILRRAEKQAKAEAAGRARAAKTRADEAAADDEARADAMTDVAVAHNRWGRIEP